ncbi:MAG TPA: SLC13 family permease [Candidatus Anammoximicrobium sp.]|nr:SLC13 family permease [Candidatus Anammoximicrobium sp.]
MAWEAWVTIAVVAVFIVGLARNWAAPDLLSMSCLTLLIAVGAVTGSDRLPSAAQALSGMGNSGLITVGALFVVVAGLTQTGAMGLIVQPLLGRPRTVLAAQTKLLLPVTSLSAFLNNTPVVAMFMPVVNEICKKTDISPSKLFMPMAFAGTFGGVCTMIGTSTNLIVAGLIDKAKLPDLPKVEMFDITWVGLPCAVAGVAYMLLFSRWLLPDRRPAISLTDDPRQYTVEMLVQPGGPLVGQSVEQAGLRHLPGLYLAEIDRQGVILPAVGPQERLQAGDRLVFAGIIESVVDLQKMRGLTPATDQTFKLDAPRTQRSLIEAVVSDRCPLVGKNIREGRFRSEYNAAVIAVARSGKRITARIGDIVLQPGDTLLLEAHQGFVQQRRNSSHFFLVSGVENSAPTRHERAWTALAILAAMVIVAGLGWLEILAAALLAGVLMILARCCTGTEARQSIEWSVLLVIGASLGIGRALDTSGAAEVLASKLISLASGHPWLVLTMVYFVTMIFTELVTNNAAAVLVFPIALAAARSLGVSFMPFAITIMVAASGGFATPIGYQTNLMVYGPGGYRFSDYVRLGVPLDLIFMTVTVLVTPWVYPFHPA